MKKGRRMVSNGTLYVGVFVFPGAEIGKNDSSMNTVPIRIKREFAAANTIWLQKVSGKTRGINFKVVKTIIFDKQIKGIDLNTEKIVMTQKNLDQTARLLIGLARKFCRDADVFVFYMNGNTIGPVERDGARILAMTYIDYPIIIMCNGTKTNDFILAHELGHVMFNNNRYGNRSDPEPFKGDPAHNANSSNLMFPTGLYWPPLPKIPNITSEQIKKALENRFFYD